MSSRFAAAAAGACVNLLAPVGNPAMAADGALRQLEHAALAGLATVCYAMLALLLLPACFAAAQLVRWMAK